ncbi:MAG: hypothetical protein IJ196_08420 [Prevotella sp.]|nr:hypothetical protein [Prevotella sp.]
MRIDINPSRLVERIAASFVVFTRVSFGRDFRLPASSLMTAVEHWPLSAWFTSALQALTLLALSRFLPWLAAIAVAIVLRMLVVERPQVFGKSYERLALVVYEVLLSACLLHLEPLTAAATLFAAGPFSRMITSQMVMMLPYAEEHETARYHIAFRKYSTLNGLWLFVQGIVPLLLMLMLTGGNWQWLVFIPCLMMYFSYMFVYRQYGGYTIDILLTVASLIEITLLLTAALTL